jgi:hypothetical protein
VAEQRTAEPAEDATHQSPFLPMSRLDLSLYRVSLGLERSAPMGSRHAY